MAQTAADSTSLHWQLPDVLPAGALIAVVRGDPTGPGESALRLSMPNGYRIPPHVHPSFEHVEVREGTLLGPYTITYIRAADAPRPRGFPFSY